MQQCQKWLHFSRLLKSLTFPLLSCLRRSPASTLWKPRQLSLMALACLFPNISPVFFLHHRVCSATVWQRSIFRNETEEGRGGGRAGGYDGVEGKGRGRFPEGSALWLALSNWLMRKASLCSWQLGDSSSWLGWYTYLGLEWSWREGLPSHCKGITKAD